MRDAGVRVVGAWSPPTARRLVGGLRGCLLDSNALLSFIECGYEPHGSVYLNE